GRRGRPPLPQRSSEDQPGNKPDAERRRREHPPLPPWIFIRMLVELELFPGARTGEVAIGAVELRRPRGASPFAIRVMLLDQLFVSAYDGGRIGTGFQPQRGISRWIPAH